MKNPGLELDSAGGDLTLMERLMARQPQALRELYDRHHGVLRAIVLHVVHDEGDADDVLQEVFLQLWTRADHYSAEKGKPLGWLITLARRRAIDRLRQRLAYRRATNRFETECRQPKKGAEEIRLVEREACRDDLRAYLAELIGHLPPRQKEVIELTFFKSLSQREIAATLRLPLGTVKTRIELGLRKLAHVVRAARRKVA